MIKLKLKLVNVRIGSYLSEVKQVTVHWYCYKLIYLAVYFLKVYLLKL